MLKKARVRSGLVESVPKWSKAAPIYVKMSDVAKLRKLLPDNQHCTHFLDQPNLEGFHDAVRQIAKTQWTKFLYLHPELLPSDLQRVIKLFDSKKNSEDKKYCMLTVNFPRDVDLPSAVELYKRWLGLNWVCPISINWELYNEEGEISHPHFHAFIYATECQSDMIRRTYRVFKSLIPGREKVDVKLYKRKDYEYGLNYTVKNREKDVQWRIKYDLPTYIPDDSDVLKNGLKTKNLPE